MPFWPWNIHHPSTMTGEHFKHHPVQGSTVNHQPIGHDHFLGLYHALPCFTSSLTHYISFFQLQNPQSRTHWKDIERWWCFFLSDCPAKHDKTCLIMSSCLPKLRPLGPAKHWQMPNDDFRLALARPHSKKKRISRYLQVSPGLGGLGLSNSHQDVETLHAVHQWATQRFLWFFIYS